MKLWMLERRGWAEAGELEVVVVAANDDAEARQIASDNCSHEGEAVWSNPLDSACNELSAGHNPRFIIGNYV